MIHFTCRVTAKNWDQLQNGMVYVDLYSAIITKVSNALIDYAMGVNPTHGNRVWATFTF